MNRRDVLFSMAATPLLLGAVPDAGTASPTSSARTVKPLTFDPTKLKGLSEKLITSHHANNYSAAVKSLIKTEEELARLKPDAPGFLVSGLRERHLQFHNSMTLHEAYFENLGGDGKQSGALAKALGPKWEESFRAAAMSLAGGSGWATIGLNAATGELLTACSQNHTQAASGSLPLVVLDMFEHAYAIDYGAAAAKYVDAFFANLKWEAVERRYELAKGALKVLRS